MEKSRKREPDTRAKAALKLLHTDLAGPVDPEAKDIGFWYTLAFMDNYSGAVFLYFTKAQSGTVKATEKFHCRYSPLWIHKVY